MSSNQYYVFEIAKQVNYVTKKEGDPYIYKTCFNKATKLLEALGE